MAFWALALPTLGLLRLPYLASPGYVLDNDEAVLGLMARRLAEGSELPLFYAGQNYGLAIFETLPVAVAFRLFGDSALVLTLTVLLVYLVGLVPYSRVFRRLSGSRVWAWILTLALALLPGWVVWSTKARGLYVSGFVLTGCALAILTREALSRRELVAAGLLMGVIGLIQPLWLTVTVPFLLLGGHARRDVALAGLLTVVVWLVPTAVSQAGEAFWQPRVGGFALRIGVIPRVLAEAFSGRVVPHQPGFLAYFIGGAGAAAFFLLLVTMAMDSLRRRSRAALAVGAAMTASLFHVVLLEVWVPRYFLPSTVLAVVAAAVAIGGRSLPPRGGPAAAAVVVIGLLAFTATRLGRLPDISPLASVPAQEDLRALIAGLESDGVRGVYTPSSDVQWQILFYGEERIPTRGRSSTDRYPEFVQAVAAARSSGLPTALVADIRQLRRELPVDSFPGVRVGERYLRLDAPTVLDLALLRFEPDPR